MGKLLELIEQLLALFRLVVNEDGSINIVSGDSDVATEATLAAIKTAVEGTVDVQLTGSTVAIPVDLQYQALATPLPVEEIGKTALAYESLTVDATVGGKGFAAVGTNTSAFITCETAQVRFTVDGTAPTITVGHLLNPGDVLKLNNNTDIAAFRAIRTGATSSVLNATFSEVV